MIRSLRAVLISGLLTIGLTAGSLGAISAQAAAPGSLTLDAGTVRVDSSLTVTGVTSPNKTIHLSYPSGPSDVMSGSSGRYSLTVPAGRLPVGRVTIVASVRGTILTATTTVTVQPAIAKVTIVPTGAAHAYGTRALVTAVVSPASGGTRPARGFVTFKVDGRGVARVAVSSNRAALTLSPRLAVGSHVVQAYFAASSGSQLDSAASGARFSVTRVAPRWATAVPVDKPAYGSASAVRVSVIAANVRATGVVVLRDGPATLARVRLTGGSATLPFRIQFAPGRHVLTVFYAGSATVAPAKLNLAVVTSKARSVISLSVPTAVAYAQTSGATIRVPGATGRVSALVDGRTVASGTLSGGIAQFILPAMSGGPHRVSATYAGDTRHTAAAAPARTVQAASSPCPVAARACVDLTHQISWLQSNGRVTYGPVRITSGRPGYRTPSGTFAVYWQDKNHFSSEFNNAPMPNSSFFNGGVAFHEGSLAVESHGCIHLSADASLTYFNTLSVGDEVYVFGYAPY